MIFKVFFQHKRFCDSVIVPRTRELGLPRSPLVGLTAVTMRCGHSDFHMGWKHFVWQWLPQRTLCLPWLHPRVRHAQKLK